MFPKTWNHIQMNVTLLATLVALKQEKKKLHRLHGVLSDNHSGLTI